MSGCSRLLLSRSAAGGILTLKKGSVKFWKLAGLVVFIKDEKAAQDRTAVLFHWIFYKWKHNPKSREGFNQRYWKKYLVKFLQSQQKDLNSVPLACETVTCVLTLVNSLHPLCYCGLSYPANSWCKGRKEPVEGQEAYGPGSWGITHLSCKLSVDTDV